MPNLWRKSCQGAAGRKIKLLEPLKILNLWWKFCQGRTVRKIKLLEPCKRAELRRQRVKVLLTAVKLDDSAMTIFFEVSVRNDSKSYIIFALVVLIHFERMFAEDEIGSKTKLVALFVRNG
jgi:hypothetical protein